jgi:ribonuclease HI
MEETVNLVKELPELLSRGGFRLTKWLSNEREVLSRVPDSERAPCVSLNLDELPKDRALGVQWNTETDSLGFRGGNLKAETRRGILSFVASVYDPLGLVAPVVLPAKRILQELCRDNQGWDESLPKDVRTKWQNWQVQFQSLTQTEIPRCYKPDGFKELKSVELHHFTDASTEGYGTASYLRLEDVEGKVHCSLIMGKSRVAPLKTMTVPRLELAAATLAVKVDKQIRQELDLPITRVIFWTDSTIVLRYIRNTSKRFHTFVANRLQMIHDASSPQQWRHVPTNLNPADLASRGLNAGNKDQDRRKLQFWFNGPEFLWQECRSWPEQPVDLPDVEDADREVKITKASVGVIAALENAISDPIKRLIHRPSCWYRLQKSVAWLLRFKKYLLSQCKRNNESNVLSGPLKVKELEAAPDEIVKLIQQDASINKQTCRDRFAKLSPIVQDDIVRVGGRLDRSPLPEESKHPAILPPNHHVTKLIVRSYHTKEGHAGTSQTLAAIR